jgi:hypothetical protein
MLRFLKISLVFFSLNLFSQGKIEESFSKSIITIGDIIEFSLRIEIPKEAETGDIPGGVLLSSFEIKDYDLKNWRVEGDKKILEQKYKVSTYTTGIYFVPPWIFSYKYKNETKKIEVPALPLYIMSLLKGEENLRDIKKPFEIPYKFPYHFLLIPLLILICIVLFYYFKKRKKVEEKEIKILLPPDVEAIKALMELKEKDYLKKEKDKEYYIELDDIFRVYLGRRFSKDTIDKTEFELINIIKELNFERKIYIDLKNFLEESSLVKYAKYKPKIEEAESHWDILKEFVEKTKEEKNATTA